jgi:hypothetical protein
MSAKIGVAPTVFVTLAAATKLMAGLKILDRNPMIVVAF